MTFGKFCVWAIVEKEKFALDQEQDKKARLDMTE